MDLGVPSRRLLLRWLGSQDLRDWAVWYKLEASDADPEITEWDDKESAQRKLAAKAAAG